MTSVPLATYRLQFNSKFGFREASGILDYLKLLGISDVYASPIFQARSQSSHGYDMVDPRQINPELGGKKEFIKLASRIKKLGLGWIQDIIPNHMSFHSENRWLMDVFEKGQDSAFYSYFDIDWNHPSPGLKGRVLAPFLGKLYQEALKGGELKLSCENGRVTVNYYDLSFPLSIESLVKIFKRNLEDLKQEIGKSRSGLNELCRLMNGFSSPEDKTKIRQMIMDLYKKNPLVRAHMDRSVQAYNKDSESQEMPHKLDELLSQQYFCLSFWKRAMEEINYRRFFSINDLISVRMEKKEVFDYFHSLIWDFVKKGFFTGLRIDHVDGLYDPEAYLKKIRQRIGDKYIVAEKILGPQEKLAPCFPVEGTTGYDWLNKVNQIFIRSRNEHPFTELYYRFTGLKKPYDELKADKKRLIIGKSMAGDVDNLARMAQSTALQMGRGQDFTLHGLRRALVEIMAQFPVYRTYITPDSMSKQDKEAVQKAVREACRRVPDLAHEFSFIEKCLLGQGKQGKEGKEFVFRFQQYTGPIMAKGFEDTLLYVYNRLISLNEVGGNPHQFGCTLQSFHQWNKERQREQPFSLNASATHDTKRGEDVRARINVLSEVPDEWEEKIKTWRQLNSRFKSRVKGAPAPDANDEYFLYQTLVGSYPFLPRDLSHYQERIKNYLVKAVREAKVHTAWIEPDHEYEQAFVDFFQSILQPGSEFVKDFVPFQKRMAFYGIFNSLSQVLLKMTLPGVPDFYQGCESWDLSLVDPDNRRPVDFKSHRRALQDIKANKEEPDLLAQLWKDRESGRIKMFLIWKALQIRKKFRGVFEKGECIPLKTQGAQKNHIMAFARRHQDNWVLVLTPRFVSGLILENQSLAQASWGDTRVILPSDAPQVWEQVLTGEPGKFDREIQASSVFKESPVVLCSNKEVS
ncbi:MAG: malto-oligosyltrehalose synthase [Candidatus Aminicenantes bacterium]